MSDECPSAALIFEINLRTLMVALFLVLAVAISLMAAPAAQAQTFTVLHQFTGGVDGDQPEGGVTLDRAGNLYGSVSIGGTQHYGVVFKMSRSGSGWIFNPLYSFTEQSASYPIGGVAFGPEGSLYGTTSDDDGDFGAGTVFSLRPQASVCRTSLCSWTETTLYSFMGGSDGSDPASTPIFDREGNLYATTAGTPFGGGTVFELSPSGRGWTETVLHTFASGYDAAALAGAGLVLDSSGNLYGTWYGTFDGNYGSVFELTPFNGGWSYTDLYDFTGGPDGAYPLCTLIMDQSGNLYGTTSGGGNNSRGTVFEMSPSNGGWTFNTIYTFQSGNSGSYAGLVMDAAGNLYGTQNTGGAHNVGNIFELSPSNGGWIYTDLHDFTGGDGRFPDTALARDGNGNLYGTTPEGGTGCSLTGGCGVVFEIMP